ncbi:guanylate kinase [Anaerotardibacter muris]|uniref:guanylate kinase n=1 Tax=Anaerotardibacter muris TaxID=2941505 RepID=UPI00203B87DB|nr:guanylate kinase [Anaerotardibacter muris]
MPQGNLFVVSGPSGAGKGTLISLLTQRNPDIKVSISATTRTPRPGEEDGVDYHFLSEESFKNILAEDGFLEHALVHGKYYGTIKRYVDEAIARGEQVILEIDVQGARQVKQIMPDAHLIFIEPPSLEELERRLRGRNTETEEQINKRLDTALLELSAKKEYDVQLVNEDVEAAYEQLVAYIESCNDQ